MLHGPLAGDHHRQFGCPPSSGHGNSNRHRKNEIIPSGLASSNRDNKQRQKIRINSIPPPTGNAQQQMMSSVVVDRGLPTTRSIF
jgi:hypothetical protein